MHKLITGNTSNNAVIGKNKRMTMETHILLKIMQKKVFKVDVNVMNVGSSNEENVKRTPHGYSERCLLELVQNKRHLQQCQSANH